MSRAKQPAKRLDLEGWTCEGQLTLEDALAQVEGSDPADAEGHR